MTLTTTNKWTQVQLAAFRIAFIYFIIQLLPLDREYWRLLFSIDWPEVRYQQLFQLTTWSPHFLSGTLLPQWGIASYANWGIALAIAVAGGIIWTYAGTARTEYNRLYYWLRVLLRVRLSIAILPYGLIKLFHVQIPAPSLSDLNTAYGDLLPWKIYYLTTGASSAYYEQTLGLLEVLGALLLLFRRTTLAGASLITAVLTNVAVANFAYRIGSHVYCTYLITMAVFLVAHDIPRLYRLLVVRKHTLPERWVPLLSRVAQRRAHIVKGVYGLFVLLFAFIVVRGHHRDRWPYPESAGLTNSEGYYNVKEFALNGRDLPYSPTDTARWQNVVFEKWNTISIRTNRELTPDVSRPVISYVPDEARNYESAGNAGRSYYSYQADTVVNRLVLRSKNSDGAGYQFAYQRSGDSLLTLTGRYGSGDSVYILLEKIDKKYLLKEGRRVPKKI